LSAAVEVASEVVSKNQPSRVEVRVGRTLLSAAVEFGCDFDFDFLDL
jgi:hypothetical protein